MAETPVVATNALAVSEVASSVFFLFVTQAVTLDSEIIIFILLSCATDVYFLK